MKRSKKKRHQRMKDKNENYKRKHIDDNENTVIIDRYVSKDNDEDDSNNENEYKESLEYKSIENIREKSMEESREKDRRLKKKSKRLKEKQKSKKDLHTRKKENKKSDDELEDNVKPGKGKNKKKKKHPKLRMFLKIFAIIMVVLIVAGIAGVVAIFKTDRWAITKEQLLADAGAVVYDKNGNEILTLTGDEINKKLTKDEMGKIPDAFIAIEDERFYEHNGIDMVRTLHAVVDYVFSLGKGSFGGSTITQQLVKITMKDDERSGFKGIERKIREWSRAVQVEKMLDKDQILERYLNRIYLGSSNGLEVRGVEAAANYYFNKSAKDLSIAQSAFLAGINHSPNSYSPFVENADLEKLRVRTVNVLAKMKELGKLTEEEYNNALADANDGLDFSKGDLSNGNSELSFHTAAAINQIAKELADLKDISVNEARDLIISSGYKIYTTVDPTVQDKMEAEFVQSKYIKQGTSDDGKYNHEPGQSAMAIVEVGTGYVVGEVGALGENPDTLGLNRGTSGRQPGSSFKPLATIAPGLENKVINAATLFNDTPTNFGTYRPRNDSDDYGGIVTIRDAIRRSFNVTEVKLLSLLGVEKSTEFLGQIGIEADPDETGLSLALGPIDVTPVQMAAGYAMIANGGVYITPTFYTKVVDQNGETVIEAKQEKNRVMTEENAYIEASILRGPIQGGTASNFNGQLGAMDVGGKTGTSDSAVDRWFCGITPYYAAACWYGADDGYDYDGNKNRMSFWGTNPAAVIWFPVMKAVHADLEVKKFVQPDSIVTATICRATGKRATANCTDTFSEIFAKDNMPGECDGHQTVKICKQTGKLATEFCTETEDKTFGVVIETEKNANWSPRQTAEAAPTETCDVHTKAEEVDVPNVVGKTEKEATEALTKAGFKVKVLKDNDKTKAKGVVLKQSVSKKAPKGSEISITVNQYDNGTGGNTTTGGNTVSNTTTGGNTTGGGTTTPPKNETTGTTNTVPETNTTSGN